MFIIIVFDRVLTRSSPVFFAGSLLFSPLGSVTGCDSSLGSVYLKVNFPFLHLVTAAIITTTY